MEAKLMKGFALTYERLVAEKRARHQKIVVMREGKIVEIDP